MKRVKTFLSLVDGYTNLIYSLPERMNLALEELLRDLFKDEVRVLDRELGILDQFGSRNLFPGSGQAIRVLRKIAREKLDKVYKADAIYLKENRNTGLYNKIWQAFCVLLPVKAVGVMGDSRAYEFVCALRAVTSEDGMTADYYPFEYEFLGKVSRRIVNEVKGH